MKVMVITVCYYSQKKNSLIVIVITNRALMEENFIKPQGLRANLGSLVYLCTCLPVYLPLLPPKIHKPISHTPLGENVLWVGRFLLQFLAQIIDIKTDVMWFVAVLVAPHLLQ
jgi:hypothetical protein